MNLNNLDSSLNISENYSSTYEDSIAVMEDYYNQYTLGNATIDTVSETSIAAIRDFRSKVVAQYAAMASLDDFAKASNFPFVYDGETDNAQKQIENANLYDLSEKDFRVVKRRNSDTTLILAINSSRNTLVEKVSYRFDNNIYPNQVSTKDTMDFYSIFSKTDISENHFSGVATIYFYNGHELEVKFSL
jgi:hypothetical protein